LAVLEAGLSAYIEFRSGVHCMLGGLERRQMATTTLQDINSISNEARKVHESTGKGEAREVHEIHGSMVEKDRETDRSTETLI